MVDLHSQTVDLHLPVVTRHLLSMHVLRKLMLERHLTHVIVLLFCCLSYSDLIMLTFDTHLKLYDVRHSCAHMYKPVE